MKIKRIVAVLLFVCLLFSCIPPVQTNAATVTASGKYSIDISWSLNSDGVLTVTGTGPMKDYTFSSDIPWQKYSSSVKSVVIGDGITSICKYAFYYFSNLTTVTVGKDVTTIGSQAFYSCANLSSITLPDGLLTIESSAFFNCGKLEKINLGNCLTYIGSDAFSYCYKLAEADLPDTLETISDYAFYYCSSLISVVIPDGVTTIGRSAFHTCSALASLTIGNNVESIGDYAFINCSSLKTVTLPASVTQIGEKVFYNCGALTAIWVDEANTSFSSDINGLLYDKEKTVLMQIPSGCTQNCTISASVTTILPTALDYCNYLTGFTVDSGNVAYSSDASGVLFNKDKTVLLKAATTLSGAYTVPESVIRIENSAFYLTRLGTIVIGNQVEEIGARAFYDSRYTTSVILGAGLKSIGSDAFYNCSDVDILLPEGLETIDYGAFQESSLMSVTVPDSVTNLGRSVFRDCMNMSSAVLGKGITEIPDSAFYGCSSLRNVTIPHGVKKIGGGAFTNCNSLSTVSYCGNATQWAKLDLGYNTRLEYAKKQYHTWVNATCTSPACCTTCGAMEGDVLAHDYQNGVCANCGKIEDHDHIWANGTCAVCGRQLAEVIELSGDGKISAFDAQILAEAKAGLRQLTDEQWQALGELQVSDIIDYVLGRFPGMKTEE